tara:strand:+ start:240 stop:743 length:504 start_codon:yes stop_codon:yes gene_type:complete
MKLISGVNIFIFIFITSVFANEKVVYLDIDYILSNSNKGRSIIKELDEKNKKNIIKLEESEKILKKKENDIENKKNILSKEELNIQIENLKKQIIDFRKEKANMVKEFNLFKKKQISNLMKSINPIIAEYVKEKSINIVLDKKNILIGKTNYDITKDILVLVDNKIK